MAAADLSGLDPFLEDHGGISPTERFLDWRDQTFGAQRESRDEDEKAWYDLVRSACVQNGIDFEALGINGPITGRILSLEAIASPKANFTAVGGDEQFMDAQEYPDNGDDDWSPVSIQLPQSENILAR